MQGKRRDDIGDRYGLLFDPGDYGQINGIWHACTPNGHLANLSGHSVAEHEDGTITVSPSIRVSNQEGELWHGFLEHGTWRSV